MSALYLPGSAGREERLGFEGAEMDWWADADTVCFPPPLACNVLYYICLYAFLFFMFILVDA
jgi:hypothetical protein